MFETELHDSWHYINQSVFREFTCTDGVIQMVDYEENDKNSKVAWKSFWINSFWSQIVSGGCAWLKSGSFRLDPPLPKEYYAHLFPCVPKYDDIEVTWYDGVACSEERLHRVIESRRIDNTGQTTCVDVANDHGRRYNQHYECVGAGLVEKYNFNYNNCEGPALAHEVSWSYQRWLKFVTGQCVDFIGKFSLKMDKNLFPQNVIDEIAKTPCGNPMANLNVYTDPACQHMLLHQELVNKDLGSDCVHGTLENQRVSTQHCRDPGQEHVSMLTYDSQDCSGKYRTFSLEVASYTYAMNGLCVEGKHWDGTVKYFQMNIYNKDRHPFPMLSSCQIIKGSDNGFIPRMPEDSLPHEMPQLEHPPWNPFNSEPDAHFALEITK